MEINLRLMVTKVMPKIVEILKARFPNLTAEESVKLTAEIAEAVMGAQKQ